MSLPRLSPSDVTLPCSVGVSHAQGRCLSCQLSSTDHFLWLSGGADSPVFSMGKFKGRFGIHVVISCALCKTLFSAILERTNDEQETRRASVSYPLLYPTFQENLNSFRLREQAELQRRGAERVQNNPIPDGSRRSSEDQSVDLVLLGPDDLPTAGPSEVDEGSLEETTGDCRQDLAWRCDCLVSEGLTV